MLKDVKTGLNRHNIPIGNNQTIPTLKYWECEKHLFDPLTWPILRASPNFSNIKQQRELLKRKFAAPIKLYFKVRGVNLNNCAEADITEEMLLDMYVSFI